jgi:crotonobetainyl-CoA:carnitine CoA-transferase CaiB-like acyl-CoA transferase
LNAVVQARDGKWLVFSAASRKFNNVVAKFVGVDSDDRGYLSDLLVAWAKEHDREEVLTTLREIGMPCAPVYSGVEILEDQHFVGRGEFVEVVDRSGTSRKVVSGPFRFDGRPGVPRNLGAALGADNIAVYHEWLGVGLEELRSLEARGIV